MEHKELCVCYPADYIRQLFTWSATESSPGPVNFLPAYDLNLKSFIERGLFLNRFMPRDKADADDTYKHLISYVVVNLNGRVLTYLRGKSGGENRLHEWRSVGVGGHVTSEDMGIKNGKENETFLMSTNDLYRAARRELEEEVSHGPGDLMFMGFLNDDSNPVGRVHLGLVYEFRTQFQESPKEGCLEDMTFYKPFDYIEAGHPESTGYETWSRKYETWSQILLQNVFREPKSTFFANRLQ